MKFDLSKIIKILAIVVLTLLSMFLIKLLFPNTLNTISDAILIVLAPGLIALFISYLISPISDMLHTKCKLNRNLSVIITIVVSIVLIVLVFVYIFIFLSNILYDLLVTNYHYIEEFLANYLDSDILGSIDSMVEEFMNYFSNMNKDDLSSLISTVFSLVASGFSSLFGFIMMMVLVPIFLYFILLEKNTICKGLLKVVPPKYRNEVSEIGCRSNEVIEKFFKGRIFSMTIMSVVFTIFFYLIGMGSYSILFGFLIGYLDIIPYIGPLLGLLLPLIYSLSVADTLPLGYITFVVIIIVNIILQFVQQNILQPKIMGKEIEIHTLLIFASMLFFGQLLGIVGFIVAVPICGIIKVIFEYYSTKDKDCLIK